MTKDVENKLDDLMQFLNIKLTEQQYATAVKKLTGGVSAGSHTTGINNIEAAMSGPPHVRGALQFAIGECRRHNLRLTDELATDVVALNAAMTDKNIPTDSRFRIKSALAAAHLID